LIKWLDQFVDFAKLGYDFKNIFAGKNWRFLAQTTASFWKNLIITLVFENWQKSPKILIITSTPGSDHMYNFWIYNYVQLQRCSAYTVLKSGKIFIPKTRYTCVVNFYNAGDVMHVHRIGTWSQFVAKANLANLLS
jgi:hypothetical protein